MSPRTSSHFYLSVRSGFLSGQFGCVEGLEDTNPGSVCKVRLHLSELRTVPRDNPCAVMTEVKLVLRK